MSVLRFEWDPLKERANIRKHGVGFELASSVFDDPHLLLEDDRVIDGEERTLAIGLANNELLLLVVHTVRYENSGETIIRIISARKPDKHERKRYGNSLARTR